MASITLDNRASTEGFTALLGLEEQNSFALIERVQGGLPFSAFERLQGALGMSANQLADSILLPLSSLARQKKNGRLSASQSEKLVRLARLTEATLALFEGDAAQAREWMRTPRAVLGGKSPLELAATELGAREVENLIIRLEDGVFS